MDLFGPWAFDVLYEDLLPTTDDHVYSEEPALENGRVSRPDIDSVYQHYNRPSYSNADGRHDYLGCPQTGA